MYFHWVKAFPCWRATAAAVTKILPERIFLLLGKSPELGNKWGIHFTRQIPHQVCKIRPILQHFRCAYHAQSSGFLELMRKSNFNWWNLLNLLICLSLKAFLWCCLRSIPFGKYMLSPFKIIFRRPMMQDQGMYEPALRRPSDLLQRTFIKVLEINSKLVEKIFSQHSQETKTWHIMAYNLEIQSTEKDISTRILVSL